MDTLSTEMFNLRRRRGKPFAPLIPLRSAVPWRNNPPDQAARFPSREIKGENISALLMPWFHNGGMLPNMISEISWHDTTAQPSYRLTVHQAHASSKRKVVRRGYFLLELIHISKVFFFPCSLNLWVIVWQLQHVLGSTGYDISNCLVY